MDEKFVKSRETGLHTKLYDEEYYSSAQDLNQVAVALSTDLLLLQWLWAITFSWSVMESSSGSSKSPLAVCSDPRL